MQELLFLFCRRMLALVTATASRSKQELRSLGGDSVRVLISRYVDVAFFLQRLRLSRLKICKRPPCAQAAICKQVMHIVLNAQTPQQGPADAGD